MRIPLRISSFFGAYHFSDIIANTLEDQLEYARSLEGFYGDDEAQTFLPPFPKFSVLRRFAEFMIDSIFWDFDVGEYAEPTEEKISFQRFVAGAIGGDEASERLWVELALHRHGLNFEAFSDWNKGLHELSSDAVYDWFQELRLTREYDVLLKHLASDVFSVLFRNRLVLLNLNEMIARKLISQGVNDPAYLKYVTSDGIAKRKRIPQWAKNAVYFRDRGRCCGCSTDLTGLTSPHFGRHFDHIVPLAEGGINDVTNLQLLCERCNRQKGGREAWASLRYEPWYDEAD